MMSDDMMNANQVPKRAYLRDQPLCWPNQISSDYIVWDVQQNLKSFYAYPRHEDVTAWLGWYLIPSTPASSTFETGFYSRHWLRYTTRKVGWKWIFRPYRRIGWGALQKLVISLSAMPIFSTWSPQWKPTTSTWFLSTGFSSISHNKLVIQHYSFGGVIVTD